MRYATSHRIRLTGPSAIKTLKQNTYDFELANCDALLTRAELKLKRLLAEAGELANSPLVPAFFQIFAQLGFCDGY
jgi:hypothetical protein